MSNISITAPANMSSSDIEFIQGNDAVPVPPDATTHIVMLLGDNTQGIDTSGDAGTNTETITALDATTAQKGVTLLASNAETIAGAVTTKATTPDDIKAKLGVQTSHGLAYGAGQTSAVAWLAEATNGKIPIGSTGSAPVLANITSMDGSVTITNGAGTIDLSTTGEISGTVTTIGAVTENVLSVALGSTPGSYTFDCKIAGYDITSDLTAGYTIVGSVRTDGTTATLIDGQAIDSFEEGILSACQGALTVSSNNAIFTVLGTVGETIHWKAITTFVYVS